MIDPPFSHEMLLVELWGSLDVDWNLVILVDGGVDEGARGVRFVFVF